MHTGQGQIVELILENGLRQARISCPENLIPAAGQYVLAGTASSSDPLPFPLFSTDSTPQGFIACAPLPATWTPGTWIHLRGPLGHGFELPASARKMALVPFGRTMVRLKGLIRPALKQEAAVVLVSDRDVEHLPDEVEVQPFSMLADILAWADYLAFEVAREALAELKDRLGEKNQTSLKKEAQILIHTPMPCGAVAECGVCAVNIKSSWKLACKDGPVFDLREVV